MRVLVARFQLEAARDLAISQAAEYIEMLIPQCPLVFSYQACDEMLAADQGEYLLTSGDVFRDEVRYLLAWE